jgi:cation transport ATPase
MVFGNVSSRSRFRVAAALSCVAAVVAPLSIPAPAAAQFDAEVERRMLADLMRDGKYLGAVGLEDTVRANTKTVVSRLRELGVKYIAIFTGDRLSVAKRVGWSMSPCRAPTEKPCFFSDL